MFENKKFGTRKFNVQTGIYYFDFIITVDDRYSNLAAIHPANKALTEHISWQMITGGLKSILPKS